MNEADLEKGFSRRAFLGAAMALAGSAVLAESVTAPNIADADESTTHEQANKEYKPTFSDPRAEQVAQQLSINPGTYYTVSTETVEAMNNGFFLKPEIAATLPPAVRQYSNELTSAAEQAGVPVSLLAIIATIESSGDATAHSSADAWGLTQVVPEYQLQDFVKRGFLPETASYDDYQASLAGKKSKVSKAHYESVFTDPQANTLVGADYLKQCIDAVVANYPDLGPNSPITYAWAGSLYNGGTSYAGDSFDKLPLQSQLYSNHVIRMLIDTEVANRLAATGMGEDEIVSAMWSNEMNARAYTYSQVGLQFSMNDIGDYNTRAEASGAIIPGEDTTTGQFIQPYGQDVHGWYQDYMNGKTAIQSPTEQYTIPAAPGLRIWLAGGGEALFAEEPVNVNWSTS